MKSFFGFAKSKSRKNTGSSSHQLENVTADIIEGLKVCINDIESTLRNDVRSLKGIYIDEGKESEIDTLTRSVLEEGSKCEDVLNEIDDPKSIGSAIKRILSLRAPLFTYELYDEFISAADIYPVIQKLPPINRDFLRHFAKHLNGVIQRPELGLNYNHVANYFSSELIRPIDTSIDDLDSASSGAKSQQNIVTYIIRNAETAFDERRTAGNDVNANMSSMQDRSVKISFPKSSEEDPPTEAMLRQALSSFGVISQMKMTEKFAAVTFASKESAAACLENWPEVLPGNYKVKPVPRKAETALTAPVPTPSPDAQPPPSPTKQVTARRQNITSGSVEDLVTMSRTSASRQETVQSSGSIRRNLGEQNTPFSTGPASLPPPSLPSSPPDAVNPSVSSTPKPGLFSSLFRSRQGKDSQRTSGPEAQAQTSVSRRDENRTHNNDLDERSRDRGRPRDRDQASSPALSPRSSVPDSGGDPADAGEASGNDLVSLSRQNSRRPGSEPVPHTHRESTSRQVQFLEQPSSTQESTIEEAAERKAIQRNTATDGEYNRGNPATDREYNRGNPATDREYNRGNPGTDREYDRGNPATDREYNRGNPATDREYNRGNPATDREDDLDNGYERDRSHGRIAAEVVVQTARVSSLPTHSSGYITDVAGGARRESQGVPEVGGDSIGGGNGSRTGREESPQLSSSLDDGTARRARSESAPPGQRREVEKKARGSPARGVSLLPKEVAYNDIVVHKLSQALLGGPPTVDLANNNEQDEKAALRQSARDQPLHSGFSRGAVRAGVGLPSASRQTPIFGNDIVRKVTGVADLPPPTVGSASSSRTIYRDPAPAPRSPTTHSRRLQHSPHRWPSTLRDSESEVNYASLTSALHKSEFLSREQGDRDPVEEPGDEADYLLPDRPQTLSQERADSPAQADTGQVPDSRGLRSEAADLPLESEAFLSSRAREEADKMRAREAEVAMRLQEMSRWEGAWSAELTALRLKCLDLQREAQEQRDATRTLRTELAKRDAELAATLTALKRAERAEDDAKARAEREALSTVLALRRLVALLEEQRNSSVETAESLEREVRELRELHSKAAQESNDWKTRAIAAEQELSRVVARAAGEGSGTIPQNLGGVPSKAVDLSGKYDLETATSSSPESSEKVETEMETGKLGINGPERPYIGGTAKTKIQLPFDHHPWQAALPSKLTAREETERFLRLRQHRISQEEYKYSSDTFPDWITDNDVDLRPSRNESTDGRETKRKMYSLERGSEPEVQRPVSGADGVEEDDDGSDRASENDGQIRRDHRVLTAKGFRQDDTAPGRTANISSTERNRAAAEKHPSSAMPPSLSSDRMMGDLSRSGKRLEAFAGIRSVELGGYGRGGVPYGEGKEAEKRKTSGSGELFLEVPAMSNYSRFATPGGNPIPVQHSSPQNRVKPTRHYEPRSEKLQNWYQRAGR